MALFVKRNEKPSRLQEKLAADLKNKLNTANIEAEKPESTILEDSRQTRPAGLIISVLLLAMVIVVVVAMFMLG